MVKGAWFLTYNINTLNHNHSLNIITKMDNDLLSH